MAKSKTYELMLKIGGRADSSLKNACMTADKNLASLGKTAKAAGKVASRAVLAVGTAVGTLGVATIKAAGDYEERLANVSTLLVGTEEAVAARTNRIGAQILEVSNRTGVATDNLTDGMYQVISAFGDSEDAATILETAAKSAAAGNATTTDSINLLSAVTKGYGDTSAAAVQKAADLSFATVRLGQTNFPELASSMGNVIPLASTLGVEQEQLFGAMATLTGVTGGTAEVTTQLKSTMQAFLSPSKNMTDALKGMGYESGKALLESKGLQGALDELQGAVGGDELAFAGLFSSVEAQTAVLSLAGTQAGNFTSKTAEMYEATGAADLAFQRQTNTAKYMGKEIINLGNNFLTELGTKAMPYVKEFAEAALPAAQEALGKIGSCLVDKVIPAAQTIVQWIGKNKDMILAVAAGVTTVVVAYKVAKTVVTAYNAVMAIYKVACAASATGTLTMAGAMAALNWPIYAVMAAILAVVTIVVLLVKHWDKVKAVAIAVWEKIKSVWNAVATWFNTNVITPLVNFFSGLFHAVSGFFKNLWAGIKGVWNAVASWFKANVITPLVNFFTPIIRTVGGIFSGCWILIQAVWKAVSTWFNTNVITPVITVFSTVVGAVSGFFTMLWGKIVAVWIAVSSWFSTNVITPVVSVFSTVVEAVGGFFSTLWDNIVVVWTAVGAWFSENVATPIMSAFQAVSDFVKGIVNTMLGFVEGMINRIIRGINFFVGGFSNIAGKAAAFIGVEWGGIPELPQVSIPRLAAGGVATTATLAMVGEGSEPEAILPLSKLAALMELWGKKPKPDGRDNVPDGGIVFAPVLHFAGPADKTEVEAAMQIGFEEFKRMYRRLKAEERRKSFHPA